MTSNSPAKNEVNTFGKAKPFLKWAGGKAQLLAQFEALYPPELSAGQIEKYIEPFLGGGAVFFHIVQNYPIQSASLYDINEELILVYKVIQRTPQPLIKRLTDIETTFCRLEEEQERKDFYYQIRSDYNRMHRQIDYQRYSESWVERAADMIFLNKTCFNGLYRVNRKGEFNVPFGRYKNPKIFDIENIFAVSQALQKAEIFCGDFTSCESQVSERSFIYFDPPYRPISKTSSFTSYSKGSFTDQDQIKLGEFYKKLDRERHAKLMLSNSNPKHENPDDHFFEHVYQEYSIYLKTVYANRMINSKATKRGPITELVVTNYPCSV